MLKWKTIWNNKEYSMNLHKPKVVINVLYTPYISRADIFEILD